MIPDDLLGRAQRTANGEPLWAGSRTLYGVREHPEEDVRKISVASWL